MAYYLNACDADGNRLDEHLFVSTSFVAADEVTTAIGMPKGCARVTGSDLETKLLAARSMDVSMLSENHKKWLRIVTHLLERAEATHGCVEWV